MALMGHSMGAAIASMFAGVFPRLVERLVLIDLIGMTPTKISKTSRATAKALEEQIQIMDKISNNAAPELDHTDAVAKAFMVRWYAPYLIQSKTFWPTIRSPIQSF